MELIAAFISGVIGPILYLLIEKYLSKHKEKKRDKVQENIANTCLIDSELQEIRDEFDELIDFVIIDAEEMSAHQVERHVFRQVLQNCSTSNFIGMIQL